MTDTVIRPRKNVFVIMPFTATPRRNAAELKSFFENNIQAPIQNAKTLANSYHVWRSGVTLDINAQILKDLARADIVVADLSGVVPNPNVMYELGVRLAATDKAVILIREDNPDNEKIFDIYGFYSHLYNPLDYAQLEKHLIEKLGRLETGEEIAESPVLRIIGGLVGRSAPNAVVEPAEQRELVLGGAMEAARLLGGAFGPAGQRVSVTRANSFQRFTRQAREIVRGVGTSHPLEAEGVDIIAQLVRDMDERVGAGAKTAALIAGSLLAEGARALSSGMSSTEIVAGVLAGRDVALAHLKEVQIQFKDDHQQVIAATAAQDKAIGDAVVLAIQKAKGLAYVSIESGGDHRVEVLAESGHVYDSALTSPKFITDIDKGIASFSQPFILVTTVKAGMRDLMKPLEVAAQRGRPLLLVAESIDDEAMATLLVNVQRGTVKAGMIRLVGTAGNRDSFYEDFAALTGAAFISLLEGGKLESFEPGQLGSAEEVIVQSDTTTVVGPASDEARLSFRIGEARIALSISDSDYDRDRIQRRLRSMTGSGATIVAGGLTENEKADARYRVESAAHAIVASQAGACLPGGGAALLRVADIVAGLPEKAPGRTAGRDALATALRAPFRQVHSNAGLDADKLASELGQSGPKAGVDAIQGIIVADATASGPLDPANAVITAVELAVSRVRDFLETRVWTSAPVSAKDLQL